MKTADPDLDPLESLETKGWIKIPDNRKSFSVAMIVALLDQQCPLQSVSRRTVQRAIADLRNWKVELKSILAGNTPYYDTFSTELIITQLNFKVKK